MSKKLTSSKAKEILHDKSVHGHPLTDKQRKFFGAIASGAAPQAQNGIEGTMGGLTDKGFNYNPAWGGAWKNGGWMDKYENGGNLQPPMAGAMQTVPMAQMGTSLPGATGMMYARTGDTPSEGPYAKKTLPSAQDGRTLLGTLSNFIPIYETYVDVKDAIMGGLTGDKDRMNQGILGLGAPFAGKAITSGIDYLTEKFLGKDVADYNETRRNDIVNMSPNDLQKLFQKYGAGGYDKWVKAGKPKLQHGGEMSFYQHGLDWTPRNISKNGSVVKDNMGYWNPDNWGKVVEIDSPNITMKGVNQDLIGISDEGDVQYMEPGKDYKFKGKKVKEYPVAKYGVNQQDEKTIEHLDQLSNFTNYNKPKAKSGGWLDKYN